MKRITMIIMLLLFNTIIIGQIGTKIPEDRLPGKIDGKLPWEEAGCQKLKNGIFEVGKTINMKLIIDEGFTNHTEALQEAYKRLQNYEGLGIIYFPSGTYYFDTPMYDDSNPPIARSPFKITSGASNILIKGDGSDQTIIYFYKPAIPINHNAIEIKNSSFVGIEDLYLHFGDFESYGSSQGAFSISIYNSENCWVRGVNIYRGISSHIGISYSNNITISGNYFRKASHYHSGGHGYGVSIGGLSHNCLVEDNIFVTLRHAMILSDGACHNVFGYNASYDPYTTQTFVGVDFWPGDMVLHGHQSSEHGYSIDFGPYENLFEGNYANTIHIDHYWGGNGSYNTFFRNLARKCGLRIDRHDSDDGDNDEDEINTEQNICYNYAKCNHWGLNQYGYPWKVTNWPYTSHILCKHNRTKEVNFWGTTYHNWHDKDYSFNEDISYYNTTKPDFILTQDYPFNPLDGNAVIAATRRNNQIIKTVIIGPNQYDGFNNYHDPIIKNLIPDIINDNEMNINLEIALLQPTSYNLVLEYVGDVETEKIFEFYIDYENIKFSDEDKYTFGLDNIAWHKDFTDFYDNCEDYKEFRVTLEDTEGNSYEYFEPIEDVDDPNFTFYPSNTLNLDLNIDPNGTTHNIEIQQSGLFGRTVEYLVTVPEFCWVSANPLKSNINELSNLNIIVTPNNTGEVRSCEIIINYQVKGSTGNYSNTVVLNQEPVINISDEINFSILGRTYFNNLNFFNYYDSNSMPAAISREYLPIRNSLFGYLSTVISTSNDFDNDGLDEYVITSNIDRNPILQMYEHGSEIPVLESSLNLSDYRIIDIFSGDYNNDKKIDLLLVVEHNGGRSLIAYNMFDNRIIFDYQPQIYWGEHYYKIIPGNYNNDEFIDIAIFCDNFAYMITRFSSEEGYSVFFESSFDNIYPGENYWGSLNSVSGNFDNRSTTDEIAVICGLGTTGIETKYYPLQHMRIMEASFSELQFKSIPINLSDLSFTDNANEYTIYSVNLNESDMQDELILCEHPFEKEGSRKLYFLGFENNPDLKLTCDLSSNPHILDYMVQDIINYNPQIEDELVVEPPILTNKYEAVRKITTKGDIIVNSEDLEFLSGENIIIYPGFNIKSGATFKARIDK